jgi:hypothetical protein
VHRKWRYVLAALAALGAALWVGRAALAYRTGTSICLAPPHLVTPEERFRKVAEHYRRYPHVQHPALSRMDPRTCCRMGGHFAEQSVTFWSTLRGEQSHIVVTNVSNWATPALRVSTDLCGEVVTHRD